METNPIQPHRILFALAIALAGCTPRAHIAPLPAMSFSVDTARTELIAPGVVHRYLYSSEGPWAINVLDAQLDECMRLVAVKDAAVAAGRIRTSDMLRHLSTRSIVVGGVNADFFSLADGTPTNLLVVDGRLFTPPNTAGVLAVDSAGVAHIANFTGEAATLRPFYPRDAVGGKPIIVRDSAMIAGIDSANGAAFSKTHHPRTAVGISRDGRRVIFVVVDGRQKEYSDGMALRQLASLMLSLGAYTAMNLDGGGSSTMVFADPAANGALRIANRPSDKEGERSVGDAVAIVQSCAR